MQLITQFTSEAELNTFLKHVGQVREADSQPLRRGKLEQHVAQLLGVADWNTALGMVRKAAPKCCLRCDEPLMPNDYCPDMDCPYHLVPQGKDTGDTNNQRLIVHARFRSDNGRYETEFDASPYFQFLIENRQAMAVEKINQIFLHGGTGCTESDDVARTFVHSPSLFDFTKRIGYGVIWLAFRSFEIGKPDESGFEVYVETEDLVKWLSTYHPGIYSQLSEQALAAAGR